MIQFDLDPRSGQFKLWLSSLMTLFGLGGGMCSTECDSSLPLFFLPNSDISRSYTTVFCTHHLGFGTNHLQVEFSKKCFSVGFYNQVSYFHVIVLCITMP